jgi:hypothetical protein
MEDPATYHFTPQISARTSADPDFIGAEAALKRAATKAIERARCAGLEPVIWKATDESRELVLREDPSPYRIVSE